MFYDDYSNDPECIILLIVFSNVFSNPSPIFIFLAACYKASDGIIEGFSLIISNTLAKI